MYGEPYFMHIKATISENYRGHKKVISRWLLFGNLSLQGEGDYFGLLLKGNRLQCIYRLGDQEPTVLTANEDIKEQFVTVVIER